MKTVCCLVILALIVAISEASHGRFGTISFKKSPSNPRNVEFTFNAYFRRSYFGAPNVGNTLSDDYFYFGDGAYEYIAMKVSSINTADDWVAVTWIGSHTYAAAGEYTVGWTSCCRIFALNNNPSYSYAFTSSVKITAAEVAGAAPNQSPVSNMLPIVSVPYGVVPYTFQIQATDPENAPLTFTQASATQQGDGQSTQPTGMTVSASGLVTLNTVLAHGFWTAQQIVTDPFGNWISVDYLLDVQDPVQYCNGTCQNSAQICTSAADCVSCNAACLTATPRIVTNDLSATSDPRTNLPALPMGAEIAVTVGQTKTVSFVVDDAQLVNPGTAPYIYTSAIPTFGTKIAPRECTTANGCEYRGSFQKPMFIQVVLAPTSAHVGNVEILCVGADSLKNSLLTPYCISFRVSAFVCGNGVIEGTEQCDGGDCCTTACVFAQSTHTCRASNGACDAPEVCSGSSSSCPADSFAPSTQVCRSAITNCDETEFCSGTSASCSADLFKPSTTVCRPSDGPCDVAETCDGTTTVCPADGFAAAGGVCRASGGVCDVAETCDGTSSACPADAFKPSTTVCRTSSGSCDSTAKCTGSDAACPTANTISPAGTVCRAANGTCDVADVCDGVSGKCVDKISTTAACQTGPYVCPRVSNTNSNAQSWFCSAVNPNIYFSCYTQMVHGQPVGTYTRLPCAGGTKCNCAYGEECSCNGQTSPCTTTNLPPVCH